MDHTKYFKDVTEGKHLWLCTKDGAIIQNGNVKYLSSSNCKIEGFFSYKRDDILHIHEALRDTIRYLYSKKSTIYRPIHGVKEIISEELIDMLNSNYKLAWTLIHSIWKEMK